MTNRFKDIWEGSGHNPEILLELFEFLKDAGITCYGIALHPKNIIKIRNELMRLGANIDEFGE